TETNHNTTQRSPMTEIPTNIAAEVRPGMWGAGWPHEKPEHALSITEAHQAMQRHAGCDTESCARKRHAKLILIDAGEMTPDPSRHG
ncbi:hypothetical protein, partial [Streptomyces sp. NPDC055990]|uniref:hypothetical protein n=1 Tax=Streptomyces sp. NPDC055990 TaxID=3345672 RepID=UPI0035DC24A2